MSRSLIKSMFETNHWVLSAQTKGLTNADSLLQPAARGNCMNWVVGHIIAYRNVILDALGAEKIWADDVAQRYMFDSEPITSADDPGVVPLEEQMAALDASQERLLAAIDNISDEDFHAMSDSRRTVEQRVHWLAWHEGYHSGQTEYLRQLTGVNDRII